MLRGKKDRQGGKEESKTHRCRYDPKPAHTSGLAKGNNGKTKEELPESIENLNNDAKRIFEYLLNLNEKSDFDNAEVLRINGFDYATNAAKKLLKYTKIR